MRINTQLMDEVRDYLAPQGVWTLRKETESLLGRTLSGLPRGQVSENEQRCPTTLRGVRAFMNALFARHFFQLQDSLLEFAVDLVASRSSQGEPLCFADIGSGPAVASIALIDLLDSVRQVVRKRTGEGMEPVRLSIVLNDVSEPCLDVGRKMILSLSGETSVSVPQIAPVTVPFPRSITQLGRLARNLRPYDLCCMSYVLAPLQEQAGLRSVSDAVRQLLGTSIQANGRAVILQDKFHEQLHVDVCRRLGVSSQEVQLKQTVYDTDNQNDEHTYTFFRCVFPQEAAATSKQACLAPTST